MDAVEVVVGVDVQLGAVREHEEPLLKLDELVVHGVDRVRQGVAVAEERDGEARADQALRHDIVLGGGAVLLGAMMRSVLREEGSARVAGRARRHAWIWWAAPPRALRRARGWRGGLCGHWARLTNASRPRQNAER